MKLLGKLLIRMEDYRQSTQLCVPLSLQQRPEVDAGMRRASGSRIGNETGKDGQGSLSNRLTAELAKKTPPIKGAFTSCINRAAQAAA